MPSPYIPRPKVKGRCVICGAPFESRPTRKTCSNACRQRLKRLPSRPASVRL